KLTNYTNALTTNNESRELAIADKIVSEIDTNKNKGNALMSAEQMPEFPGGMKAFYEYLSKSIQYPAEAKKNNVSGKVILSFIVEKNGSLNDIKVLRGVGSGLDEEAIRVMKGSPKWLPGKENGKPVRVAYTLPMQFSLGQGKPEKQNPGTSNGMEKALYILDGKEVSEATAKSFDPEKIATVNVLKGENAGAAYGEKGKNGVVLISTKNAGSASNSNENIKVTANAKGTSNVSVNTNDDQAMFKNFKGLIIIDGKESDKAAAVKLDPNEIATVNVMKGGGVMNAYGEKGKNGVIVIVTKKN
ncbi:MAG: TonB family protein, partial [Daejeonella sp.]